MSILPFDQPGKMNQQIRIGTRDSQLALWQANFVKDGLKENGVESVLVPIQSEGDKDLVSPLYEMGVQGIFTRSLDIALLDGRIDIAVHSMKDVPTKLPNGIIQAAVLERASSADVLVYKNNTDFLKDHHSHAVIATSSIRRKAQWLNRYPNHRLENLRGNVNTRLRKLQENEWNGAIFAAAGLERINLLPENSVKLDWMLPAPAQGAIVVVCREADKNILNALSPLNHDDTALCVKAERDFLRELMGGCSTPISALAVIKDHVLEFRGSVLSEDGKQKQEVFLSDPLRDHEGVNTIGIKAAHELLRKGGKEILQKFGNAGA